MDTMVSLSLLYAKYAPKYEHSKEQLRAIQETGLDRRIERLEAEEQGGARDDGREPTVIVLQTLLAYPYRNYLVSGA
jgi:hypothetical protein